MRDDIAHWAASPEQANGKRSVESTQLLAGERAQSRSGAAGAGSCLPTARPAAAASDRSRGRRALAWTADLTLGAADAAARLQQRRSGRTRISLWGRETPATRTSVTGLRIRSLHWPTVQPLMPAEISESDCDCQQHILSHLRWGVLQRVVMNPRCLAVTTLCSSLISIKLPFLFILDLLRSVFDAMHWLYFTKLT